MIWHYTDEQFTISEFTGVFAKMNTFIMSNKMHDTSPKYS